MHFQIIPENKFVHAMKPDGITSTLLTKSQGYLTLDKYFSKFPKMFVNDSGHYKMTLAGTLNAQI